MTKRLLALLVALLMVVGVVAACDGGETTTGQTTTTEGTTTQGTTTEGTTTEGTTTTEGEPTGLGPDMLLLPTMENMADKFPGSWDNYGLIGRMMLFSRLLRLDKDLKPVYGDLADEWTESEDALQYTFTLHEGVKWHDGEDFSADDVAFSLKTAMKAPQVNGVIKGAIMNIKGAKDFQADEAATAADDVEGIKVDGNVITIDMEKPSGTFLLAMAQFNIFPRHKIEGLDVLTLNSSEFYDWPIGTGPYMVKEFKPNDYALLEAFPDYFGNKPIIQQVKMTQMTQADYAARAMANEIDFFHINDLATAQAACQNPNYEMNFVDIYFVRYFNWNSYGPKGNGVDPFKTIESRRAFAHAIDRQALIDNLMPGQAALINSKVPTAFEYANKDVYDLKYDPDLAKSLLTDVGFDFNTPVKLACYYADQGSADFMDAVVAYLTDVGMKAEWILLTGDLTAQLYETRDYNLTYAGLSAMAVEEAYNGFHSDAVKAGVTKNLWPIDVTLMDSLIEELWVTTDAAKRNEILADIQVVETEQMLWHIPMFSLKNIQVFNKARVNVPDELVLSNEWSNYERYIDKWTINAAD